MSEETPVPSAKYTLKMRDSFNPNMQVKLYDTTLSNVTEDMIVDYSLYTGKL